MGTEVIIYHAIPYLFISIRPYTRLVLEKNRNKFMRENNSVPYLVPIYVYLTQYKFLSVKDEAVPPHFLLNIA